MVRLKFNRLFIIGCSLAALGTNYSDASTQATLTRFSFTEYHMGVDARIVVYAPDQSTAEKACSAAFDRIAELDSIMSDYRKESELNRLCAKAGGPPVWVSKDLFLVLQKAREMSRRSNGAFDISVGPMIALWRPARKNGILPDQASIKDAKRLVGYRKIRLDPKVRGVRLTEKGMKLDLGGIAKGYADDEAQRVLREHGITSALVEMGGDVVVSDPPPGTKGWTIRVPNAGTDKGPRDMTFKNCGISTSGDTEQFAVIGGKRYSHVVDPRTGWALTNRVQSTIIAPTGLLTDPLSTAFTVVDPRHRKRLMRHYPEARMFIREIKD